MNKNFQTIVQNGLALLLKKINAVAPPFPVAIRAEQGAEVNSCFYNVSRKVTSDGGKPCYGWAIILSKHIIEAEKHAIWESPTGEYVDITPANHSEAHTAFVIDNEFVFKGQLVDNVRINLTDNKIVDDWIAVCETINLLYNLGKRTGEHIVTLPENVGQAIKGLESFARAYQPFVEAGGTYTGNCFCGRLVSYEKCHGFGLKNTLNELVTKAKSIGR